MTMGTPEMRELIVTTVITMKIITHHPQVTTVALTIMMDMPEKQKGTQRTMVHRKGREAEAKVPHVKLRETEKKIQTKTLLTKNITHLPPKTIIDTLMVITTFLPTTVISPITKHQTCVNKIRKFKKRAKVSSVQMHQEQKKVHSLN